MKRSPDPPRLKSLLPVPFFLLSVFLLTWVAGSAAYVRITNPSALGNPPLSWKSKETGLVLGLGCPASPLTAWGPCWDDAAEEAAAEWNGAGAQFQFRTERRSVDPCGTDSGRNTVVFANDACGEAFGSKTLALTFYWYDSSRDVRAFTKAQVFLNTDGVQWSTYAGPLPTDNFDRRIHDFYRVALHEFGHVLGLGHPDDAGQSVRALMHSRVSDLYQLQTDDIDGIRHIYGRDNRVPVSLAVSNSGEVVEGQAALTITATLTQSNTSGSALSIPVRVRSTGTTAQATDYTVASSISIADTALTGTTTFAATNDTTDEADEQVIVELGSPLPTGIIAGTPNHVTVTLTDNDPTTVTFSIPDTTATEGDATATARLRLTLGRALVAGESLDIPLQFSGGIPGTDFTLALSGSPTGVTFSAGTVTFTGPDTGQSATAATLVLTAAPDANATAETVTVSIPTTSTGNAPKLTATNLDGGATGSGSGQIIITDAPPVLTITPGSSPVTEGMSAAFTVRASPAPATSLPVSLVVAQTGDFAASGTTGAQTITIGTGGTAPYTVATVDDNVDESHGTVTITITPGSDYTVGRPASASVTVQDNDEPPPSRPTGGGGTGGGGGGGGGGGLSDTHGNTPRTATPVAVNTQGVPPQRGQFVSPTDRDTFVFDLPWPGLIIIESQSALDTRARLFDAALQEVATDDHSGPRQNFRLGSAVAAGVYYLAVDSPRGSTGAYTLRMDYRPGYLEIPGPGSTQSGVSVLSGWICAAEDVMIEVETGADLRTWEAAYGTAREDTIEAIIAGESAPLCGDSDNGYGLLFNWNELGAGAHTVRAVVDGVVLAEHAITVAPLGAEPFRRGLSGTYALADFPHAGATTTVEWSEAQQNFVLATGAIRRGVGDTTGPYPQLQFENPGPGTYQSGVGVISGWVCEAERVDVVITPERGAPVQVEAAYGTARVDTQAVCGDGDNGFGLLFNWNRLGAGAHVVALHVDEEAVAQSTIRVTTLGAEFARGLRGRYPLAGFPTPAEVVTIEWQQSRQNFGITGVE